MNGDEAASTPGRRDSAAARSSPWLENADRGPGYPPLELDIGVDVAVVGGGIAGVATALELSAAGVEVALLEAREIATGVTGHTSGKLSALHGPAYARIERDLGAEAARAYAELNRDGVRRVHEIADEHGFECALSRRDAVIFAERRDELPTLEAELEAADRAGLAVESRSATDLPFAIAGAIALPAQAQFDAVAWAIGAAGAIAAQGGRVHEHTRVRALSSGDPCRLITESGAEVTAGRVLLATHVPILDRGLQFARLSPQRSHALAVSVRSTRPTGMYINAGAPTRSIRPIEAGESGRADLVLLAGESRRVGESGEPAAFEALESFARNRLASGSTAFRWSAHDGMSADRLPFFGPIAPRESRILVSTGYSKWGLAASVGAASRLTEIVLGRDPAGSEEFDPRRLSVKASLVPVSVEMLGNGRRFLGRRLTAPTRELDRIMPGEGAVVRSGRKLLAVHRDESGELVRLSARCTHLGCIVAWNAEDRSWDCPCHGSRFAGDGSVLQGPATAPLRPDVARAIDPSRRSVKE